MSIQRHLHTLMTTKGSTLIIVSLLALVLQAAASPLASAHVSLQAQSKSAYAGEHVPYNPVQRVHYLIGKRQLAPSVQVLDSLPPTFILQFPLVPSGIKALFPNATALVTIVEGSHNDSAVSTVTIDVQHMPPNITFTIFFIELANKPFGNVEYVADLTTRGDGSGETIFQGISVLAFAMDARNPGTSQDGFEGLTSGTNLEHMGMWFSSLQDAQRVLKNSSLKGTIFDGGSPPLHAGPQAMTDGQTDPVF